MEESRRNRRYMGEARRGMPLIVVALAVLAAGAIALAQEDEDVSRGDSEQVQKSGHAANAAGGRRCPDHSLRLPGDAIAPAVKTALRDARSRLGAEFTQNARATVAERFPFESLRARGIKQRCGKKAARRTVDVGLFFPKGKPSASISQGEVFVSRFESGYRVWNVAH
jgi:hypothetical protein